MELGAVERVRPRGRKSLLDQVIAIPHVFIASEAEEVIDNATARCRDLDLVEVGGHIGNLSRQFPWFNERPATFAYD